MPQVGFLAGIASKALSFLSQDSDPEVIAEKKKAVDGESKNVAMEAGLTDSDMSGLSTTTEETPKEDPSKLTVGDKSIDLSYVNTSDMSTDEIKALQERIGTKPDGQWGQKSQAQLERYQKEQGIKAKDNVGYLEEQAKALGIDVKSYGDETQKWTSGKYAGEELTIDGKPIDKTRSELGSGGDLNPQFVQKVALPMMKSLKEAGVPGLKLTGGNDAYHQSDQYMKNKIDDYVRRVDAGDAKAKKYGYAGRLKELGIKTDGKGNIVGEIPKEAIAMMRKKYGSRHASGSQMDFTTSNPEAVRKQFIKQGAKKRGDWYIFPDGRKIKDEYKGGSAAKSGGHFHFEGDGVRH